MGRVHKRDRTMYGVRMVTAFKVLVAALACYAAIIVWVYASQRRMLYCPSSHEVGTPADDGMAYEDLRLPTASGGSIHAWYVPCDNARFTLLFSHGNAGNITHRLASLRIFHDLGLSVLVYDYSGYGRSDGETSEEATRTDARAAWDWLVREQRVQPESIILFGRSLGGAVTARLAADLVSDSTFPAALILESTFTSVPDMGAYIYPWLPVRLLSKYRYDSEQALTGLTLPILFAHSPDDDIVPYALGRRLHNGYGGPKQFLEMRGGHNSGYVSMESAYPAALDQFLRSLEE